MREGWEIVKLDEVISFERGLTYAKGDEVAYSSVGVLRSNNVDLTTQSLNLDEIKYLREDFEVPTKKKVRKSSLLMCMSNGSKDHLGKVALIDRELDYAFGGFMGLLTPDKGKVFPKYLYYALASKSFKDYIHSLADGANINNLKYKDLAAFDIVLPSLPEQQRIVDILDREFAKIDALKANAEKSLQAAKDLFRKSMDILLSPKANWTEAKLGEICTKIGSGATPSGGKRAYQNEGINLIRSLNVHNNEFRYDDLAHINAKQASLLDNVEIHSGDVLFNITGASVARCCLVPDDAIPARVNQHVSILRLKPGTLIPSLLVFIMISPYQNERLMKTAENGATRQAITKRELEEWRIKFPGTAEEQQAIITHLNDLDNKRNALHDNYQKTLTLCDDLKQSLLRKAFNGEL